jgi:murein L,D-transpeptidase YcbB/YkuD
MIGKLFIPLAIGGGLMFLLSSSAGASPSSGPAQKNPFEQLPDNLRQLAGQAQATNDPGTLEQVASQLEAQGYREQPRLLRVQAAALRQATLVPASALSSASSPGFVPAMPSASPAVASPTLSPDLQKMVADAIQNGTAPVLTSTAFVLEKAGFQAAADALRQRAKQAAASVPPPAAQDLPNASLDPTMPADLALQVARQLQLQGDPNVLEQLVTELRKRGFNNTADQVEAKAQQIRTMLDAARTMHDINNEFNLPGTTPTQPGTAPSPTLPAVPGASAALPGAAPVAQFPLDVIVTPPGPIPVPSTPQPQQPAPEKSKTQILAEALSGSLNDLLARYGSVPKARYKEDKGLVQRFQSQEGLTADGTYGPTTAAHVGRYVADVPPPFYWPKGAGQRDLSNYRSDLQTLALEADQIGNTDRAERLRQSSLKASLA